MHSTSLHTCMWVVIYLLCDTHAHIIYIYMYAFCRLSQTKLTDMLQVVGKSKLSTLDTATTMILKKMPGDAIRCQTGTTVTVYKKVLIHRSIVVSRYEGHHNNCNVIFTDLSQSRQVCYGSVEQFLTCFSESDVSLHVAIVTPFEVEHCELFRRIEFPPEIVCIQDLLASDFVSVTREQDMIAIPMENITRKCFDASTRDCSVLTVELREYDSK